MFLGHIIEDSVRRRDNTDFKTQTTTAPVPQRCPHHLQNRNHEARGLVFTVAHGKGPFIQLIPNSHQKLDLFHKVALFFQTFIQKSPSHLACHRDEMVGGNFAAAHLMTPNPISAALQGQSREIKKTLQTTPTTRWY